MFDFQLKSTYTVKFLEVKTTIEQNAKIMTKSIVDYLVALAANFNTIGNIIPLFTDFNYKTDNFKSTFSDPFYKWTPKTIVDSTGVQYGEKTYFKWSLAGIIP